MPSSVIAAFYYDKKSLVLKVVFLSGLIYDYKNVPEEVYQRMKAAESKGTFLNAEIKDHYDFEKIGD